MPVGSSVNLGQGRGVVRAKSFYIPNQLNKSPIATLVVTEYNDILTACNYNITQEVRVMVDISTGWVTNVMVVNPLVVPQFPGSIIMTFPVGVAVDNNIHSGKAWQWSQTTGFSLQPYP